MRSDKGAQAGLIFELVWRLTCAPALQWDRYRVLQWCTRTAYPPLSKNVGLLSAVCKSASRCTCLERSLQVPEAVPRLLLAQISCSPAQIAASCCEKSQQCTVRSLFRQWIECSLPCHSKSACWNGIQALWERQLSSRPSLCDLKSLTIRHAEWHLQGRLLPTWCPLWLSMASFGLLDTLSQCLYAVHELYNSQLSLWSTHLGQKRPALWRRSSAECFDTQWSSSTSARGDVHLLLCLSRLLCLHDSRFFATNYQ